MEPDFREAITQWLETIAGEELGPAQAGYATRRSTAGYRQVLLSHLPADLCARIDQALETTRHRKLTSYWHAWPLLSDADVAAIMKAGAANYIGATQTAYTGDSA